MLSNETVNQFSAEGVMQLAQDTVTTTTSAPPEYFDYPAYENSEFKGCNSSSDCVHIGIGGFGENKNSVLTFAIVAMTKW